MQAMFFWKRGGGIMTPCFKKAAFLVKMHVVTTEMIRKLIGLNKTHSRGKQFIFFIYKEIIVQKTLRQINTNR